MSNDFLMKKRFFPIQLIKILFSAKEERTEKDGKYKLIYSLFTISPADHTNEVNGNFEKKSSIFCQCTITNSISILYLNFKTYLN